MPGGECVTRLVIGPCAAAETEEGYRKWRSWQEVWMRFAFSEVGLDLLRFLEREYAAGDVYPPMDQVLAVFRETPLDGVRCVVVGQDPYCCPGQAHGLAFSVPSGVEPPPSLRNVLSELVSDLGISSACCEVCSPHLVSGEGTCIPSSFQSHNGRHWECSHSCHGGVLSSWAKRGVLLLNRVLTVRRGEPGSHRGRGWEEFTSRVIDAVCARPAPTPFVLWGADAKTLIERIPPHHPVVLGAHPSPNSAHRGFFGGRYFSKVNEALRQCGESPIDWSL